jgi:hypothetical protein
MDLANSAEAIQLHRITMKHISIGGLDVSRIGLGAMSMAGYYNIGAGSDAESIRTIHRALDLGVTHLDTAEISPRRNWCRLTQKLFWKTNMLRVLGCEAAGRAQTTARVKERTTRCRMET